jgi:hypothetical protein
MDERVLRHGRVVDAHREPIPAALVSVEWGTAPTPDIARLTNEAGEFQVALPPGHFRIVAVTEDGRSGQIEVEGSAGDEIVLHMDAAAPEP